MRRHPALHPLSRDHHDLLMHARRLQGKDARVETAAAVERFLRYRDAVLVHHFNEEEQALLPHLPTDLGARLVAEHNDLRRQAAALADGGDPKRLGEALRAHARFEEETVFAHLQEHLREGELADLGARAAALRKGSRPDAGHGEDCFLSDTR